MEDTEAGGGVNNDRTDTPPTIATTVSKEETRPSSDSPAQQHAVPNTGEIYLQGFKCEINCTCVIFNFESTSIKEIH